MNQPNSRSARSYAAPSELSSPTSGSTAIGTPLRVLNVVNKCLPKTDYRRRHSEYSCCATAEFVAPTPFEDEGDRVVLIGFAEGLSARDIGNFYRLYRYLRKHREQYDVLHFFSTKLVLIGPLVAAAAGIPSIVTITGLGRAFNREAAPYAALRLMYRILAWCPATLSKAVLFQNAGDMQMLTRAVPRLMLKASWVGSGVDGPRITSKEFAVGPLRVLMVGRVMKDKGVSEFMAIAERLSGPRFTFTLAGPASRGEDALQDRVLNANARQWISYRGNLGAAEIATAYETHHVLLFLSKGEGMARVMLEAAYGLLCPVASSIPANGELMTGESGVLLPLDRLVTDGCAALLNLERDRDLVEKYARRFQFAVAERFSVQAYARRLDAVLTRIRPSIT